MKKRATRSGGFTLIELLVVIAIIAILASLLVPALAAGKVAVRKSLCLSNQRQMALATQMYGDDSNGAFPKADPIDHTLWIKSMFTTHNFSTLKIFEDPAEREGGNDSTKLRTFPIIINGERRNFRFIGINERLAGPNGIEMPTYQSLRYPRPFSFLAAPPISSFRTGTTNASITPVVRNRSAPRSILRARNSRATARARAPNPAASSPTWTATRSSRTRSSSIKSCFGGRRRLHERAFNALKQTPIVAAEGVKGP